MNFAQVFSNPYGPDWRTTPGARDPYAAPCAYCGRMPSSRLTCDGCGAPTFAARFPLIKITRNPNLDDAFDWGPNHIIRSSAMDSNEVLVISPLREPGTFSAVKLRDVRP